MNDNLFYMNKDGNLCRNNHTHPMNDRIQEIRDRHADEELLYPAREWSQEHHDRAYLLSEVERLQEVNKLMKEALEWYADPDKHEIKQRLLGDFAPISLDKGEKARTALSHLKG